VAVTYNGAYANPRLDLGEAFWEYMFTADTYIGTSVFAPFDVPRKEGTFSKITREKLLQPGDVKRAARSAYNRDEFGAEDQTYACVERGREVALDHSERELYKYDFDAELASSRLAWNHILLAQEQDIATAVLDGTTTFTTANGRRTDVAAAWSTATTDIIGDVLAARESIRSRTGLDANAMVIGAVDLPNLISNTAIRNSIQYTRVASVAEILDALAALFGIEKIFVGKAVRNTGLEGAAATVTDVWGTGWASIMRVAMPNDNLSTPCYGRTLMWKDDTPGGALMETYEEPQTRSTIFRARLHADELEIDPDFAQLLDTAA
jgi:hypothetical protein